MNGYDKPTGRRPFLAAGLASGLLGLYASGIYAAEPTSGVVVCPAGRFRGLRQNGLQVFRGIRYGMDTRARRFQPALPAAVEPDIVDCREFGPASPQRGGSEEQSEDCLWLNLVTPAADDGRRPVMVYLHGGAYASGSGASPLYDGSLLATRGDAVVVTLNHRLNLFGYLYLARLAPSQFPDSGNVGQLDLLLALDWIRTNIAAFGGDPQRVMLFGQSGGGAKIATLMAMPAAHGKFHRAATMSGQQVTASGPLNATRRARAFLAALALPERRLPELLELPAARLLEAATTVDPILGAGSLYFGPVLDGRTLARHPFYPDAPPLGRHVPMIIGNTHDETRGLAGRSNPGLFALSWEELPERLAAEMRVDIHPEQVIAAYRQQFPAYSPSEVFFAASTAGRSWRGAVIEAELRAAEGSPAWVYQLDFPSPMDGGKWGAPHMHDIALVFGTLGAEGSLTGTGPVAEAVSRRLQAAFLSLAHRGTPNHRNTVGLPHWEPYRLPRRSTLIVDTRTRLEDDPRRFERELFARVPYIQAGT
jgi:para-nitrobenzyl esterase